VFSLVISFVLFLPGFTERALAQSVQDVAGIVRGVTDQGFRYMTGGIGIGERETMQSWGRDYNLKLSFAEKVGVFLSDVKVSIERDGRETLRNSSRQQQSTFNDGAVAGAQHASVYMGKEPVTEKTSASAANFSTRGGGRGHCLGGSSQAAGSFCRLACGQSHCRG
jgi:hypothetical protein